MLDLARASQSTMRDVRGAELAMIFQEPMTSLNPVFPAGEQIAESIRLHQGKDAASARAEALRMLELVRIPEARRILDRYPHQLSGGMRQRVMIAMALSCKPLLLIADEPTTALDVTIQAQILELIRKLQRELGMAVLFITHNLGVAAEIADRIVVMYAGRVVEEGPSRALFHRPRMPYTLGLLRSVPRLGIARGSGPLQAIRGNVPDPRHLPPGCPFAPRCDFFAAGRCDVAVPPLDLCEEAHRVRCVRWREVAGMVAR